MKQRFLFGTIFSFLLALIFASGFVQEAQAQTTRISCKQSNKEYTLAQKKADRLTSEIAKTKQALAKLESNRQKSLAALDNRLKMLATQVGTNTAKCFVGAGITSIFKGKGDYQQCIERAKKAAEAAAERAARTKLAIEMQKSKVNSTAESRKALLEQKLTRLEAELATQQATAAAAKASYDSCVAAGGIA